MCLNTLSMLRTSWAVPSQFQVRCCTWSVRNTGYNSRRVALLATRNGNESPEERRPSNAGGEQESRLDSLPAKRMYFSIEK